MIGKGAVSILHDMSKRHAFIGSAALSLLVAGQLAYTAFQDLTRNDTGGAVWHLLGSLVAITATVLLLVEIRRFPE